MVMKFYFSNDNSIYGANPYLLDKKSSSMPIIKIG